MEGISFLAKKKKKRVGRGVVMSCHFVYSLVYLTKKLSLVYLQ